MSKMSTTAFIVVAVCVTVLGLGVVAALTLLVLLSPPGTDLPAFIAAVVAGIVAIATAAANFAQNRGLKRGVEYLANGGTDAKVRAGLADIIRPELLKDDVHAQLETDRAHRAASPSYKPATPAHPGT